MTESMLIVDTHHHFLPAEVLGRLQEMAGGKPRLVNDRISITLNPDLADIAAHLEAMDTAGVNVAILTNSGVSVLGTETCRILNAGMAEIQARYPDRFVAAAHVDLDDETAPDELDDCIARYATRVVALQSSSPTRDLDDPSLDPLWSRISDHQIPVILHPPNLPRGAALAYGLERSCARPFDTTQAAVRLICGVLPRFPKLRFVLPHCGGTTPFLKGRIAMFFNEPGQPSDRQLPRTQREQRVEGLDRVFEELWSKLYFDTAGTGGWSPVVNYTAALIGTDHLVFGTDYPLESHDGATMLELVEMIADLDCSEEGRVQIAGGTAFKLFGDALAAPRTYRS